MKDLSGKVAVVTGGGSGIGEGMARAFREQQMKVVVADVDLANASRVAADIGGIAVRTDVRDPAAVEELADRAIAAFGEVHVLCNNAGVAPVGSLETLNDADWLWGLGVNLDGIVHGLRSFLPRMQAQAGEAHVVNTASMAGVTAIGGHAVYCASKHATVALSETVRREGAAFGVSASVLCPGMVRTGILDSARNAPAGIGVDNMGIKNPLMRKAMAKLVMTGALEPLDVGRTVVQAIKDDELYVFTHKSKGFADGVSDRLSEIEHALLPT